MNKITIEMVYPLYQMYEIEEDVVLSNKELHDKLCKLFKTTHAIPHTMSCSVLGTDGKEYCGFFTENGVFLFTITQELSWCRCYGCTTQRHRCEKE